MACASVHEFPLTVSARWNLEARRVRNVSVMRGAVCVVALGSMVLLASGNSLGVASLHDPFVAASAQLKAKCVATAKAVGYPVPCPLRVPAGLMAYGGRPGCTIDIIGPAEPCPNTAFIWRGWVVGSSVTTDEHLVLVASPRPIHSYAKVVNGPAWRAGERVRALGPVTIRGWRMHEVFVPAALNDGSAFAGHVVLIWTVGRHTYAFGFHDVSTIKQTLALDLTLGRSVTLIAP
jgi:hypothetical protein